MLGTRVCGSRPRNGEINWNQVVYLRCLRLVSFSGVRQLWGMRIFPNESWKLDGSKMEV